jgi:hypothetical protein
VVCGQICAFALIRPKNKTNKKKKKTKKFNNQNQGKRTAAIAVAHVASVVPEQIEKHRQNKGN